MMGVTSATTVLVAVTSVLLCMAPRYTIAAFIAPPIQSYSDRSFCKLSHLRRSDPSTSVLFVAGEHASSADASNARKSKSPRKKARSKSRKLPKVKLSSGPQTWRVFGVMVHPDDLLEEPDPKVPVNKRYLAPAVLKSLMTRLKIKESDNRTSDSEGGLILPDELIDVRLVRRSLDARKKRRPGEQQGPRFAYVLDVDISSSVAQNLRMKHQPGRMEQMKLEKVSQNDKASNKGVSPGKTRVVIVGAGPAGLFCALTLARSGLCKPILLERGQPVESRGKDIGALMHRRSLNEESNFAFGEGGAGTWSDGKLTTRIGRNSGSVRFVLETLVKYGAPERILVDGSPHLGTDNLVRLLRAMRDDLRQLGGEIRFGSKVTDLHYDDGVATGVSVEYRRVIERGNVEPVPQYEGKELITGDAVVLATGHCDREICENLNAAGVQLEAKGFATGFRVEHPQTLINDIQYGREWGPTVVTGKSQTDEVNRKYFESFNKEEQHDGKLPVPSYRLATDKAYDGAHSRGVYSFCMCPGGQIVPASTNPEEVCVNGMSFSRRDSQWANSALVVTVAPDDDVLEDYRKEHGVLAGIAFQRDMERRASLLGGGNLTVPVQRLTDFVDSRLSPTVPSSSYRLGVKSAPCHELYPPPLTKALRDAVVNYFEKKMPGFLSEEALLHGVETRTSSPVRVPRDPETLKAIGIDRLYPAGEGAGFAGGIVSAAVDGLVVGEAILEELHKDQGRTSQWKTEKSVGFNY